MFTRYVFVPAALPLTVVALALAMAPNQVTYTRLMLGLAALALIAQPAPLAFYSGLVLFLLSVVMDSVDGNIARYKDQASYYGKFLDGFIDNIGDFLFPLALSVHVYRTDGSADSIFAAAAATMAIATTFTVLNRHSMIELVFEAREGRPADRMTNVPRWLASFMEGPIGRACQAIDIHGMNVSFDLRYAAFFVAAFDGAYREFLLFLAGLNVITAIYYIAWRMVRAYCYLNVHRRSRSARLS